MTNLTWPKSDVLAGKRLVDLTIEIYEGMASYPGHQRTVVFDVKSHEDSRRQFGDSHSTATMGLIMSDHGPTHTDAISHVDADPDAPSIDRMPLHMFYTAATCLDVTHVRDPSDYLSVDDLEAALADDGLEINPGETVLLHTGHWDRNHDDPDRWLTQYGGLTREATEWLADRGVVNIGVDAPSIDSRRELARKRNDEDDWFPAHRVCKERGVSNTEKLANLGEVVGQRFTYIGLPLPIRNGTASPIRSVALVEA